MSALGISVLIVEDNPDHYRQIVRLLTQSDPGTEGYIVRYNFIQIDTLYKAIQTVQSKKPDVILLDLGLPDSYGKETFEKMYEVSKNIPIIVTTVLEDASLGLQCMREGAFAYFVKSWIDKSPLLLHVFLQYAHDVSRQAHEIRDFMEERLGKFRPLIPQCSWCEIRIGQKRWKDESGDVWYLSNDYVTTFSSIRFADGICPECYKKYFEDKK
ncbi:response regulator [Candidatus Parcubacteria bacterium]|nr:MAG: response regulator [Candidatus Parcubacteria bacterium]